MTLDRVLSKHQPRVISVLSYYLTSLVNLSFCGFDPVHVLPNSPTASFAAFSFGEMALCLEWLLSLRWSFGSTLRQADSFACIKRPVWSFFQHLLLLPTYAFLLRSLFYRMYFTSSLFVIRASTFNDFIAYCIGVLYGIQLFALSREVLPVHWYHLLCL